MTRLPGNQSFFRKSTITCRNFNHRSSSSHHGSTERVNHAMRIKNSLFKKAKQKDKDSIWQKFREKRKEVKYLIRSKRKAYLEEISNACFSEPKRFWSYFNPLSVVSKLCEWCVLKSLLPELIHVFLYNMVSFLLDPVSHSYFRSSMTWDPLWMLATR